MSIFLRDISFFLLKGFLSQTPSTMHDEAMRTRISAGFDYSVFCIPVFIYNTSLVGTIFPRMHWQHQFPVATVLLQYFLAICFFFFFFYLCVKNTCRGEGKLDQYSAYFREHHFLWKDLVCFPVFWVYSGL